MKLLQKRLLWATAFAALFLAAFIGGCKKDVNEDMVGMCPVVVSTDPANMATGVPVGRIITVTFNEKMNPATITQESFILQGAAKIPGTLTYDEANAKISFEPTVKLLPNTTYTGRVTTSVKDLMGNALQTDYVWSFSTGSILAPTVIFTDPANNDTGVVLNKTITATFSVPMDPLSVNDSTFLVRNGAVLIAGAVSYTGTTAFFRPAGGLVPNTVYTATITTGAKNGSGTALENNYVWTFKTGTTTAPVVVATDPANNAVGVVLNKIVTASFSEPMDPLTIPTSFIITQGGAPISGTVSYIGTTASFTPSPNFLPGAVYTATITTGAKNLAGVPLANDYVWSFMTQAGSNPPFVDLKSVERFGIIAGVGIANNAGFSVINNMDVGISPGVRSSVSGFPPAIVVNGAIYASDDIAPPGIAATLVQAKQDLTDAYLFAEGASTPAPATVSGDIGGLTLPPGIYKTTSTLLIQSGDLTLDAQGDPNAVWIFQVASGFTTVGGAGGNVILIGGAQAKNVFWQTGSSATIGDFTSFKGNILALTSITMNSGATATGRMLVQNGSVVLTSTNIINKP